MRASLRLLCALTCTAAGFLGPAGGRAHAQLRLPAVFADGLVLQQQVPVPVWGWAAPGTDVTVSFRGQTQRTRATADGRWLVRLTPLAASAEPADLVVAATAAAEAAPDTLTCHDVVTGEVWFCSGQSNMRFPLKNAAGGEAAIAAADLPLIRVFLNQVKPAGEPQSQTSGVWPTWKACSPAMAGDVSAVAFFFARDLQAARGQIPIGLIQSAYDWTPAEAWVPREALTDDPELRVIVERWDTAMARFAAWQNACAQAKADGTALPERPAGAGDPTFAHRPACLFNGAVNPFIPFAIRGVLWYQGETNDNRGIQYRRLFPTLIESWRDRWGQGSIPFLFVQLASVLPPPDPATDPRWFDSEWSEVREAQNLTLDAVPNTGMAVALDLGDAKDVHPKNKLDVGRRLALAARAVAYGERIPHSGPRYAKLTIEQDKARLHFTHPAEGLVTCDGQPPARFLIAGVDRAWHPAQARIDGATVLAWSPDVPHPVAVRYAWANNPAGANLWNQLDGKPFLPAGPFRTDDWPGKSTGVTKMFIDP